MKKLQQEDIDEKFINKNCKNKSITDLERTFRYKCATVKLENFISFQSDNFQDVEVKKKLWNMLLLHAIGTRILFKYGE